jgi:hypothetical protein
VAQASVVAQAAALEQYLATNFLTLFRFNTVYINTKRICFKTKTAQIALFFYA